MRPGIYIHKGIQKRINAIGKLFVDGTLYKAALYNPKDRTKKIVATAVCYEEDGKKKIPFVWTGEQTDKLKVGFATIEIYDAAHTKMIVRDNFAVIRINSLPITEVASTDTLEEEES